MSTRSFLSAGTGTLRTGKGAVMRVILIGGSAASTIQLQDGGAGGPVTVKAAAPIGDTVDLPQVNAEHVTDIYYNLAGTGATALVYWVKL